MFVVFFLLVCVCRTIGWLVGFGVAADVAHRVSTYYFAPWFDENLTVCGGMTTATSTAAAPSCVHLVRFLWCDIAFMERFYCRTRIAFIVHNQPRIIEYYVVCVCLWMRLAHVRNMLFHDYYVFYVHAYKHVFRHTHKKIAHCNNAEEFGTLAQAHARFCTIKKLTWIACAHVAHICNII